VDTAHALEQAIDSGSAGRDAADRSANRAIREKVPIAKLPAPTEAESRMGSIGEGAIRDQFDRWPAVPVDELIVTEFRQTPPRWQRLGRNRVLVSDHSLGVAENGGSVPLA